jgi:hypothetical protein
MGCENCGGGCGGCGGCARELTLTEGELEILDLLAQIPFLPVARRIDDTAPIWMEEGSREPEEYSLILQCLEKKGLIRMDFDQPLKNAKAPAGFPLVGSMALTERGQGVLELLDIQGVDGY